MKKPRFFLFFRVQGRLCERHAGPSPQIPPGIKARQYLWRYCFFFRGAYAGRGGSQFQSGKKSKFQSAVWRKEDEELIFFFLFFTLSGTVVVVCSGIPKFQCQCRKTHFFFPHTPIIFLKLFPCKRFSLPPFLLFLLCLGFNKSSFPPRGREVEGGEKKITRQILFHHRKTATLALPQN